MNNEDNNYRGHVIIPSASGPSAGPWLGNYSVWRLEDDGRYTEVLEGFVQEVFSNIDSATTAATNEARIKLDEYLGVLGP